MRCLIINDPGFKLLEPQSVVYHLASAPPTQHCERAIGGTDEQWTADVAEFEGHASC